MVARLPAPLIASMGAWSNQAFAAPVSAFTNATPLEMARAYATLANGGYRLDSSMFRNEPIALAATLAVAIGCSAAKLLGNREYRELLDRPRARTQPGSPVSRDRVRSR